MADREMTEAEFEALKRKCFNLGMQVGESEGLLQASMIVSEVLTEQVGGLGGGRLATEVARRIQERSQAVQTLTML